MKESDIHGIGIGQSNKLRLMASNPLQNCGDGVVQAG